MEQEQTKAYYAIIPANVRYDKDLPPNAKLLYGEITALTNDKGYCWATNEYFSNLYNVSSRTIINWINSLVNKEYLIKDIIYKDGSKQIVDRYLRLPPSEKNFTTSRKNLHDPSEKNFTTPSEKNFTHNNTITNNTINNIYKDIIDYLNNKAKTKYQSTSNATKRHIDARLNEKYTFEDFKKVIDNKCNEWIGTEFEKFLRPETLFGTKFESYLNQKNNITEKKPQANIRTRDYIDTSNLYDNLEEIEI